MYNHKSFLRFFSEYVISLLIVSPKVILAARKILLVFSPHISSLFPRVIYVNASCAIIQAVSQWSSEAWKIYICENPTIRVKQQLATI